MAKRGTMVTVSWWGTAATRGLPARVLVRADGFDTAASAVSRAVARVTGMSVVTMRPDGTGGDGRKHYEMTIGKRAGHGCYSVEGSVWCAVDGTA